MNLNPFHLLRKAKSRVARRLLALTSGKGEQCGTQNKANRDQWLKAALMQIAPGSRILDAGAGTLRYKPLCAHLDYVSQDFCQYDGVGDGSGLHGRDDWQQTGIDIVSDIASIPEPDASFDAVMCIEVLEHVPQPVEALRELVRLLRPGGTLILTAPFCALSHMSPYFYQTGYSDNFYRYWLERLGMNVMEVTPNGNYFEYLAQELRRLRSVSERYTSGQLSRLEQIAIRFLLLALARLSESDTDSSELLCYGYHVRAVKALRGEVQAEPKT
jgi:SAM-dependent methyltransferase